jgi:DNA-binding MltR family transcriptional regulator
MDDVCAFREALTPETDRGCALMGAAYLDVELERLLTRHFVNEPAVVKEVLGQNRPLGSFSSRIDICYLLGLLGKKTHRDLHLIRKIRNDFAHQHKPITFAEQAIASRCNEFYHDGLNAGVTPRERYTRTVLGVLAAIHAQLIRQKPTEPKEDLVIDEELRAKHKALVEGVMAALTEKAPEADAGAAGDGGGM